MKNRDYLINLILSTVKKREQITTTFERSMLEPGTKQLRIGKHDLEAAMLVRFLY